MLGENRYGEMFPDSREGDRLTWSKFRQRLFDSLTASGRQSSDGSWNGGYIGPIFSTCTYLTILQLDSATLPIYQR